MNNCQATTSLHDSVAQVQHQRNERCGVKG